MEKNKIVKAFALTIFLILVFVSAVDAFVPINSNENEYITSIIQKENQTIYSKNREIKLWEDHFTDMSKIDTNPPGDGISENYVVSNGEVSMINTYSSWTDPDWNKMKPIMITNNEGETISNYQLKLTVDYDSDMQDDYDDLRFKHEDDVNTWLDYWIESSNSSQAIIWILMESVPTGTSDMFMFYGNSIATSESDFSSVFSDWEKVWSNDVRVTNHLKKEGTWDPDVSFGNGEFIVSWEEGQSYNPPYTFGFKQEIRASMYEPDGDILVNDTLVFKDSTLYFRNEDPSIDYGGNRFFISWEHYDTVANPDYTTKDIKARTAYRSGSDISLGSVIDVCDETDCQADPNVQYDSNLNKFLVAWEDARSGGNPTNYDIYGNRYTPSGGSDTEKTIVSSSHGDTEPWIAYDPINERYMIVWEEGDHPANGPFDIKMGLFDSDIKLIGTVKTIAQGTTDIDYNFPCVEYCAETSRYLITWNEGDISDNDWWGSVYGIIYNSSGKKVVDKFQISSGEHVRTDIVPYLFNSFFVTYDDHTNKKIAASLVSSEGDILYDTLSISVSGNADWSNIAVGNDRIFVAWEDKRIYYTPPWNSMPDVFANIIYLDVPDGTEVSYTFGSEKELILNAYITSIEIESSSIKEWNKFFATFSESITFDILDGDTGSHIQSVSSGNSISGITATSIRLMASFTRSNPSASPSLDYWNVSWIFNNPPNTPSDPNPSNGAFNIDVDIELSWTGGDPDGDEVTYNVFFEAGDSSPDMLVSENQSSTSYDPGTLEFNTLYYWQIIAYDTYGVQTKGPVWSFTTKANNPPNTPSGPYPSNGATNVDVDINLSWTGGDPDGDNVFYDVYFGKSSSPSKVVSNQSSTTYNPGILELDNTYYWRIIAWDEHGSSTKGPIWYFTTKSNNPPNTPSNPNPSNGATNVDPNADLSWSGGDPDPEDTVVYDVYFGTYSPPPLEYYGYNDTTYEPGTLSLNTKYYWKIIARDNHGSETEGIIWDFTTKANSPPNTPSNPDPFNGETNVHINTDLNWSGGDPDGDEVTYNVFFEASDSSPDMLVSENQSGTSYDPGTLEFNTLYYWQIIAYDTYGAKTKGAVWSFTTKTNNPPNTPSNPDPKDKATNVSIYKGLNWTGGDPDGDEVTYNVYFGLNSSPLKVSDNQSYTSYDPGILNFKTTYYWRIVAYDSHGASAIGSKWSFTTKVNNPPNIPFNPNPSNNSDDVPIDEILSWSGGDPDDDEVLYDVYFGTNTTPQMVSNHQSAFTFDPDLVHNTTYFWKIVAWDDHGDFSEGPLWSFTTIEKFNSPPNQPRINCNDNIFGVILIIKPNVEYEFEVYATDFDDDDLFYFIDWGDNTTSEWDGPHKNGISVYFNHTWGSGIDIGSIKVKAKDKYGAESSWGYLFYLKDTGNPTIKNVYDKNVANKSNST